MTIRKLVSTQLTDRRPQIFASKDDGSVWSLWKVAQDPDSAWTPWQRWPAATIPPQTTVHCAGKLSDGSNQLFGVAGMPGPPGSAAISAWKLSADPNAGWSSWVGLGYNGTQAIAAGTLQDGRLQFFVVQDVSPNASGGDLRIKSQWKTTTVPSAPFSGVADMTPPNLACPNVLIAASLSDSRLQLIGATSGSGLVTTWKEHDNPNAPWVPWQSFPGTPQTNSSVGLAWAPLPDRRPQLWSFNRFGDLHSSWKVSTNPNSAWTTWAAFPGAPANIVAFTAVPLSDGRVQLWAADGQNGLFTTWKASTHPDAAWLSWQAVPAP